MWRVILQMGKKQRFLFMIISEISFYKEILMKITPVQEQRTEKVYTVFDRNWARNVENRSKYLFTHMSEVQLSVNRF